MKKLFFPIVALGFVATLSSCKKDEFADYTATFIVSINGTSAYGTNSYYAYNEVINIGTGQTVPYSATYASSGLDRNRRRGTGIINDTLSIPSYKEGQDQYKWKPGSYAIYTHTYQQDLSGNIINAKGASDTVTLVANQVSITNVTPN